MILAFGFWLLATSIGNGQNFCPSILARLVSFTIEEIFFDLK